MRPYGWHDGNECIYAYIFTPTPVPPDEETLTCLVPAGMLQIFALIQTYFQSQRELDILLLVAYTCCIVTLSTVLQVAWWLHVHGFSGIGWSLWQISTGIYCLLLLFFFRHIFSFSWTNVCFPSLMVLLCISAPLVLPYIYLYIYLCMLSTYLSIYLYPSLAVDIYIYVCSFVGVHDRGLDARHRSIAHPAPPSIPSLCPAFPPTNSLANNYVNDCGSEFEGIFEQ